MLSVGEMQHVLDRYIFDAVPKKKELLLQYKARIVSYFATNVIDGKAYVSMDKKSLATAITEHCDNKKLNAAVKGQLFPTLGKFDLRVDDAVLTPSILSCTAALHRLIHALQAFEEWTQQVKCITCHCVHHFARVLPSVQIQGSADTYPVSIRVFVAALPDYDEVRLANDIRHLTKQHSKSTMKCKHASECAHLIRCTRDRSKSKNWSTKRALFATHDKADINAISLLDRAHCVLKHRHQLTDISVPPSNSGRSDVEYMSYSHGFIIKYHQESPKYKNLEAELTKNNAYAISSEQFVSTLAAAKRVLADHSTHIAKEWRATKTSKENGIRKGDKIYVEHILCLMLYCNHSALCTAFRSSFRQGNEPETRHIGIFYWFGLHLGNALDFWGERAVGLDKFYHGLQHPFLFDSFSHPFSTPLSTTLDFNVTQKFNNGGSGITLELRPDYNTGSACYLDVSTLSDYAHEKERLVEYRAVPF